MIASSGTSSRRTKTSAEISTSELDASCRLPLFALFGGAAFWLLLSSVFGMIGSIKFHSPKFLADIAWLTYGRVYPAWSNLLLYGFCVPAGIAVGLWLMVRLTRTPLMKPLVVVVAAKLWHLGVLIGCIGILVGGSSGFEWLEMPRYASVVLLVAFLLIALCAFGTYNSRRDVGDPSTEAHAPVRESFPSEWFVLAAFFWFPWIFSTAALLLEFFPVRGIVQASIAWWFSGNLLIVWLSLAGLASLLYFLPKLANRPLQSRYLALFIFLTLILFGPWVGIPSSAPLPAWMPALSRGMSTLMLVPALGIALCAVQTVRGVRSECRGGPLCFAKIGTASLVFSLIIVAANGVPQVARITEFTWFRTAHAQLILYGFFSMSMFSAAYYILPRVAGLQLPFVGLRRLHFWCALLGVVLLVLPLFAAGVVQGLRLLNVELSFIEALRPTLMFLRLSSVGELLIAIGNAVFLLSIVVLIYRHCRTVCTVAYLESTASYEPAEATP